MSVVTKIAERAGLAQMNATGLCAGSSLRTPCGPKRIENIRTGDLIVTRDEGLQPVRMIWQRTVTAAEIQADPALAPVRIGARTVGPMMPQQELRLASGHRVLVPGWRLEGVADATACLVSAGDIARASDTAHVDKSPVEITYYNVVFDRHQVFCVNGLPVESFLPTVSALSGMAKDVVAGITDAFPELGRSPSAYPPAQYPVPEAPQYRADFG